METKANTVIIGAGIVGCAVAEHLARLGRTDVVVLDQGPLFATGGSTSHAPGLMFQTNASKTTTALASYSVRHYSELELDGAPCFYGVGSVEVAATPERWQELKRKRGLASAWGLEAHLITPEECAEKSPLLDHHKVYGGLYVPSDGIAKAVRVCEAMARRAESLGVRFQGETEVLDIEVERGRVRAVETDRGRIETDTVLSCAGMWGPRIMRMVGIYTPLLTPMQHQFVWTGPLEELAGTTAESDHVLLRHQDHSMYFRQRGEGYGIGSYRHRAMPVSSDEIPRHADAGRMPSMMQFTPEDFEEPWQEAVRMLPALEGAEFDSTMNGLFSFTPDGAPLLGESRSVRGFWSAEAVWITHGAGVGRVMAEWLVKGAPGMDISGADVNRFEAHARSPEYVVSRSSQSFSEVYDVIHPQQPIESPRPLRTSPFYPRQKELGAYFLEASGWERPQWYEANRPAATEETAHRPGEWAGRYWSPAVAAEHRATRETVAMFDMTALKTAEVWGPGALGYLQSLCTNELDKPVGKVVYTLMLDVNGGIRSDITVARTGPESFQLGINGPRDVVWLEKHLPADGTVQVRDTTSGTCCVGVWGPHARDLVQSISPDDLSNESFGFFNCRHVYVGEVPVLALRVSYVGELGWELYTTADLGLRLWDRLWEAGQTYGVVAGGRGAFNGLRIEKGYRAWGTDITTEHDPYEAGLGFAVKLDKDPFVGREALMNRFAEGPRRRLAPLTIDDGEVVVGGEPVWSGDCAVGYVTSAAYGYSVGQSIAYAWLPPELAEPGTSLEVEYFGDRHPATVAEEPMFDPEMKRMRGAASATPRPLTRAG